MKCYLKWNLSFSPQPATTRHGDTIQWQHLAGDVGAAVAPAANTSNKTGMCALTVMRNPHKTSLTPVGVLARTLDSGAQVLSRNEKG